MTADLSRSLWLTRLTALVCLHLGPAALWLGWTQGAIALGGFGVLCLLQVPPALSLGFRLRGGLGNEGLERDRLTLRTTAHLLRLLALGLAGLALLALQGGRLPTPNLTSWGLPPVALLLIVCLWGAKRRLAGLHPVLELDAARSQVLLELAMLLAVGSLLGIRMPWADAVTALALAIRIFFAGQGLAKATALEAACGGCGSGCGCG